MAFFCPNSFKKDKVRHDAYSAKEETEQNTDQINNMSKPSFFEVVEDYFACSALELPVKAGEIVQHMSSEGQWIFVRTENGSDGYIPRRHCRVVENAGALRNASDISDVGYYSDHMEEPYVRLHGNRVRGTQYQYNCTQDSSYYSSLISSSSASPSSTVSSNYKSSSNTRDYITRPSDQNNPDWSDSKGLYKPRSFSKNYMPDISPKIQVQRYPQTNEVAPICGRKCKQGCVHRSKRLSHQEFHAGRKAYGAHKSSVMPVSSREYNDGSYDGNRNRDMNYNFNKGQMPQEKNLCRISTDLKKAIISDTQNSLNNQRELQDYRNAKRVHTQTTKTYLANGKDRRESCHSAPADLIKTKCGHPEVIVIKDYAKQGETDITVEPGDFAAIINDTKYEDWVYIINESGKKGFVPSECVIKHDCEDCQQVDELHQKGENTNRYRYHGDPTKYDIPDMSKMIKLAVIENYSGRNLDDLYVCIGDFVYVSTKQQSIDGWYWVFSPRQKCSGYLPRNVVKNAAEVEHATV